MDTSNPIILIILISSVVQILLTVCFSMRKFQWTVTPPVEVVEEDLPKYSTVPSPDEEVIELQPLPPVYTTQNRTAVEMV